MKLKSIIKDFRKDNVSRIFHMILHFTFSFKVYLGGKLYRGKTKPTKEMLFGRQLDLAFVFQTNEYSSA
jgi:hypothetical protein